MGWKLIPFTDSRGKAGGVRVYEDRETVLCPKCAGKTVFNKPTGRYDFDGDEIYQPVPCDLCEGKRAVVQVRLRAEIAGCRSSNEWTETV